MAFPSSELALEVEIKVSGAWVDSTTDVRTSAPVLIEWGRQDEGARVDPGKCSLVLNNRHGKYSARNPNSPYYSLIGRNTPIRISVHEGSPYLHLDGDPANYASTPDHASLDITGDLDIRAEAEIDWYDTATNQVLIAKWDPTGNQRSYSLRVLAGQLTLNWSPDGSANGFITLNLPPEMPRRAAVRATLDADNGAGGCTLALYWAPSLDGPWAHLPLSPVTIASTTSIYAGTAPLRVGGYSSDNVPVRVPFVGAGLRFEVRSGIGGTLVAAPDFTTLEPGATSLTDPAGRTWTLQGAAAITRRRVRFCGEVSTWPGRWDLSGQNAWVSIQGAGIMRRLGQGAAPVQSPMRREFSNPARASIVAYWACEDGQDATELASAISGAPPLAATGGVDPAAYSDYAASSPLPRMKTGTLRGAIPSYAATGELALRMFLAAPSSGVASEQRLITITTTGTAAVWTLSLTAGGDIRVRSWDSDGASLLDTTSTTMDVNGLQVSLGLELTQNGSAVDWQVVRFDIAELTLAGGPNQFASGTLAGRTVGRAHAVRIGEDGALGDTAIGHIALADGTAAYANTLGALIAWRGETARDRIVRLCAENEVPLQVRGLAADTALVGPQRVDTLLELLETAAAADGGVLYELRDETALAFRSRATVYNQWPVMGLDFQVRGEVPPGIEPVDDDQTLRNDIVAKRDSGASARSTLKEGTLSVQPPPDGVGRGYDDEVTVNVHTDAQLPDVAGWLRHLGTYDAARWPAVPVNLAAAPHLVDDATALDIRDRLTIDNPPPTIPPDRIDLLVEGYTETLNARTWDIVYNCAPAGPWNVAHADDLTYGRADTEGTELATAATSTATTLTVVTTSGPYWTLDCAQTSFDLRVSGEVVTATDVSSGCFDTFTRTESSSWGDAETGQTWTTSGGSASHYNVGAGVATHSLTAVNSSRYSLIPATSPIFDQTIEVQTSALATGGAHYLALAARWLDTSNSYLARLAFNIDQTVTISLRKRVSGTETELAAYTIPGLTHAAGTAFGIRFAGSGSTLQARAWLVSGTEPSLWHVTATDTSLTAAGSLGVRSILSSANTNALPVTATWDNYTLYNPQRITATRSVNGIAKALPSGSDVRLAHPAIVAL